MKFTAFLQLFVLLAGISLAGCSSPDLIREARPATLNGTAWRVVAVNGRPPVAGGEPTAVFAATEVKGSAGCNFYVGRYTYDASTGAIAFSEVGMTAMACAEAARNDIEALFTQAISQATSASIDPQGRLLLSGPGGEILLTVDAVPS